MSCGLTSNEITIYRSRKKYQTYRYERPKTCETDGWRASHISSNQSPSLISLRPRLRMQTKGKTIGIFPRYWYTPEPTANELEAYLWGESNGRLQMRTSRGGGWW